MRRAGVVSRHISLGPAAASSASDASVPLAEFLNLGEALPGAGQDLSPGMRAGFVTLAGADSQRLFFVESGGGSVGVPLLCVPGAMGTALTDFRPQLEGLSALLGRPVISFDPRGYGRSRPPTRVFTPDFYHKDAEDALQVMKALGHSTFDLLGWSDGGNSSVLLAAKYPAHVRRLVIFGSNSCVTQKDLDGFEKSRDVAKNWSAGMKATHLPIYGDELQKLWDSFCDANIEIVRAGGDVCQEQAKAVKCKTLILHGEKDPLVGSEHPKFYLSVIPDSAYHGFKDGKHNIHIKYHSEFNAVVHAFLAKEEAMSQEELKKQVGYKAVDDYVTSGMVIGLGTGSTAYYAVERVGQKLASGELTGITAIPTSERTQEQAEQLRIPLATLDTHSSLDVAIDGADAVDPAYNLVKGGGGAHFREKIVEARAKKFVVIVDESKLCQGLGPSFPVPVEIVPFCHLHTARIIESLPALSGARAVLRLGSSANNKIDGDKPAVTDNGNYIVDLHFSEPIADPAAAARQLTDTIGVVEHGFFIGMASQVIIAGRDGITVKQA